MPGFDFVRAPCYAMLIEHESTGSGSKDKYGKVVWDLGVRKDVGVALSREKTQGRCTDCHMLPVGELAKATGRSLRHATEIRGQNREGRCHHIARKRRGSERYRRSDMVPCTLCECLSDSATDASRALTPPGPHRRPINLPQLHRPHRRSRQQRNLHAWVANRSLRLRQRHSLQRPPCPRDKLPNRKRRSQTRSLQRLRLLQRRLLLPPRHSRSRARPYVRFSSHNRKPTHLHVLGRGYSSPWRRVQTYAVSASSRWDQSEPVSSAENGDYINLSRPYFRGNPSDQQSY
jgi:hypothetical protein